MSSDDKVERVSVKKNKNTFAIVEGLLAGFDFMIFKRNASNRERRRIATEMREAVSPAAEEVFFCSCGFLVAVAPELESMETRFIGVPGSDERDIRVDDRPVPAIPISSSP